MRQIPNVIDVNHKIRAYRGPYQEIAIYVRELLKCDYALVAVPEEGSIRIDGFAGRDDETYGNLAAEVISRLRDWGPVVVDDARLIAAPVSWGEHVMGILIGYSSNPGTFTAEDLGKLMECANVARGIFANAAADSKAEPQAAIRPEELRHFSRLITAGELSACFGHEVNNPLTLIRGHLRFIEESLTADHPLRPNFDAIDRASRRIEEMAKRMLDFTKKRKRRTESCDVAEIVADALHFVQPYLRTSFVDVQIHIEPQLPVIQVDRWQMVQAVVNLVQNAADAMAAVDRRVLSITARIEQKRLRLVVSDTGTGIPPGNVSKIFESFFTTKGDRGTGLGLYITKQVVEEHRGTIQVQTGNPGTSFVISLPL